MNKLLNIFLCFLLALTLISCGEKIKSKEVLNNIDGYNSEKIIINFGEIQSEGHISVEVDNEFKRLVEEKSNGRIIVEIYTDGELGTESEVAKDVQLGNIHMQRSTIAVLSEYYNKYNILMLPYLFRNEEHMYRVLENGILNDFLYPDGDANFIGLSWFYNGDLGLYTKDKEINSVEDFKGLNIRIVQNEVLEDTVELLGANCVHVDYKEIYEDLENGKIDGTSNNFSSYMSSEHNKIAKYYNSSLKLIVPELYTINKDFFNSLEPYDQAILLNSAKEASVYQAKLLKKKEEENKQLAIESGTIITEFSEEKISELKEIVLPIYDKYAKENSELIDDILSIK